MQKLHLLESWIHIPIGLTSFGQQHSLPLDKSTGYNESPGGPISDAGALYQGNKKF